MKRLKIGEAFSSIRNGATIQQDKVVDGTPVTRIETIADGTVDLNRLGYASIKGDNFKDFYLQDGDILMSHINSVSHLGKVAIFENRNEKIIHGMNLLCLKVNSEKLLPKYAFYYLKSLRFRNSIKKITKKSVNQASFNISNLREIEIPLPSLSVQIQIATILSKAENLISQRKESIRLLDEFLKSSFLEMFGNPVTNKAKFEIVKLKKLTTFLTSGGRGWSEYYSKTGERFIRSLDVQMNYISNEDAAYVIPPNNQEANRTKVQLLDILLTITGSKIGRVAIVPKDFGIAYVSQHVAIIRTKNINPLYLSYYLGDLNCGQYLIHKSFYGQTKPGLNFKQIENFDIIVPPIELQTQFAQLVEKTESLKEQYKNSLQELENLYGSLSQKAFKGELTVQPIIA